MREPFRNPNPPMEKGKFVIPRGVGDVRLQQTAEATTHGPVMVNGVLLRGMRRQGTQQIIRSGPCTVQQQKPSYLEVRHTGDSLKEDFVTLRNLSQLRSTSVLTEGAGLLRRTKPCANRGRTTTAQVHRLALRLLPGRCHGSTLHHRPTRMDGVP